jgi:hypothetical protein
MSINEGIFRPADKVQRTGLLKPGVSANFVGSKVERL